MSFREFIELRAKSRLYAKLHPDSPKMPEAYSGLTMQQIRDGTKPTLDIIYANTPKKTPVCKKRKRRTPTKPRKPRKKRMKPIVTVVIETVSEPTVVYSDLVVKKNLAIRARWEFELDLLDSSGSIAVCDDLSDNDSSEDDSSATEEMVQFTIGLQHNREIVEKRFNKLLKTENWEEYRVPVRREYEDHSLDDIINGKVTKKWGFHKKKKFTSFATHASDSESLEW
jgi:hypothetical protein